MIDKENFDEEQFRAAMAAVKGKLLLALKRVDAFSGLSEEQLHTLRDNMSDQPWDKGDFVFYQGDEGDTFYVVIEGEAEVLRQEAEDEP